MALPPLSDKHSRDLYWQLAAMEKSGLPPALALGQFDNAAKPLRSRAAIARKHVQRGMETSRAGRVAGLFAEFDAELLNTAEATGKLGEVYSALADFYEEKTSLWQQMKAKSVLPVFVFSLALFIDPLPDLILQRIDFAQYLRETAGVLLEIALGIWAAWRLRALIRLKPVEYLQMTAPFVRGWYVRRQMKNYFHALALMLAGGLSLFVALPKARNTVNNSLLRRRLQKVETGVRQGLRFHESLATLPGVNPTAVQLIKSGEMSGALDNSLSHYVRMESESIKLHNTMLAEWLPRLFYWLVLANMAHGLVVSLGGDSAMPLPELTHESDAIAPGDATP